MRIGTFNEDTDGDGLPDVVETDTGFFIGPHDTGTDPENPDTDEDGFSDGQEVALTFREGPRVSGLVVDPDGRPVPHANVVAWEEEDVVGTGQTGDDGRFVLVLESGPETPVRVEAMRNQPPSFCRVSKKL